MEPARARLFVFPAIALAACASSRGRPEDPASGATSSSTIVVADSETAPPPAADLTLTSASDSAAADARTATPDARLSTVISRLAAGRPPVYPRMSRRNGEEGWVEIAIDVQQDGEVVGLAMVASSGSPRLEEAALSAARTWRFHPRTGPRGIDRLHHRVVFRLARAPS
jgi:protein TonB